MTERWLVMTHYGDERLTDESSDAPYSVILPEGGSYPEDIICEVWGTERDDVQTAQQIVDDHNCQLYRDYAERLWHKAVNFIPIEASFAQAPEWEPAISKAIDVWINPTCIGDRRKVIDVFNVMLYHAPDAKDAKEKP